MTDIEAVRALTGNNEISDAFIAFFLDSVKKFILAYCNIDTIPDALHPVYIEITAQRVNANCVGGSASMGQGNKNVASVSDGNQTVNFSTSGSNAKAFFSEEDIISSYGTTLGRFRRMVVDKTPRRRVPGTRRGF